MKVRELAEAIGSGVATLRQELPPQSDQKLARLVTLLEHWNTRVNLTSIRDNETIVSAHILDSLAARPWLVGTRIVDVGTGAGFPGLPLAIAEPDLNFELLDSNGKKIAFVQHAIGELGLKNAVALKRRAEHYAPGTRFDTVVTRAFAAIPEMIELAGHLVSKDGVLLALKGKYPHDELRQLGDMKHLSDLWDHNVTELTVPGIETHARHVVVLQRKRAGES